MLTCNKSHQHIGGSSSLTIWSIVLLHIPGQLTNAWNRLGIRDYSYEFLQDKYLHSPSIYLVWGPTTNIHCVLQLSLPVAITIALNYLYQRKFSSNNEKAFPISNVMCNYVNYTCSTWCDFTYIRIKCIISWSPCKDNYRLADTIL